MPRGNDFIPSPPQASAYKSGILSSLQYRWEVLQGRNDHSHLEESSGPKGEVVFHEDGHVHDGEDKVAQKLAGEVRVLCWIMTQPKNHKKKVTISMPPQKRTLKFCLIQTVSCWHNFSFFVKGQFRKGLNTA